MTSRQYRFALPVVLALLIVLPSCKDKDRDKMGTPPPLTISLVYTNGQCTQNNSSGMIDVPQNQVVTYVTASVNTPFYVQFSTCPFAAGKCPISSPNGAPQSPGAPSAGTPNTDYYYSSITINNQNCNNAGQMGLHIKPIASAP